MVNPVAVRAWRRDDTHEVFLATIPERLADAMHEAFVLTEGSHKRAVAGALAGAWYLAVTAIADEPQAVPEKITRLRQIFRDFGTMVPQPAESLPED